MKIICNQKLLASKIGIAQKAINGKATLELLKGLLLTAKNDQLKITGYDLEIGIETYAQSEVIEEGEIVLNLENNTPELIAKLNKSKNNVER